MSLIVCPKTTEKVIAAYTKKFNLRKIPKSEGKFEHGNFNDSFYDGLSGLTKVIFTGYSGSVVGQALLGYASEYVSSDPQPEIYFIGSLYAFRDAVLAPGDLAYARDTFSPDSFEQSMYGNAVGRGIEDVTLPNPQLLEKVLAVARQKQIVLKPSKVYCSITPAYFPHFSDPMQMMNEAMWWKKSLRKIEKGGCDSGEYESAAALACSRLLGIPAVALFDVKDKRYSETEYRTATPEQKSDALNSLLDIVKDAIVNNLK